MRRRDFDNASTKSAVNIGISHNRNGAVAEGQLHGFADEVAVTLIVRVNRHCCIAQHSLRPRSRQFDKTAVRTRVAQVIHPAGHFLVFYLVIGKRGSAGRTPVHQILTFIEQVALVECNKDLAHGL